MSANARFLAPAVGIALFAGGLFLFARPGGAGWPLILLGGLILASIIFEGRYARSNGEVPPSRWERTAERFIDDETGKPLEVWVDPLTGARRYEKLSDQPQRPDSAS